MTETAETAQRPLIDAGKILDTILNRQNQYYTLWGFYTVVQFSAAGFGAPQTLSFEVGFFILVGVWAFNLGHLAFVWACVAQLNRLRSALDAAIKSDPDQRQLLAEAVARMSTADFFWQYWDEKNTRQGFLINSFVHLLIDCCASGALIFRMSSFPTHSR
jgi:hypothetical protein